MSPMPASAMAPCGCQARTGSLGERIRTDIRETTAAEWVQIALAAGALFVSWRIYQAIRK